VLASFWGSIAGLPLRLLQPVHLAARDLAAAVRRGAADGDPRRRLDARPARSSAQVIITLVKNVVSTYIDRWNTLLGAIFVVVIMFMPFGIVPGVRQLWRAGSAAKAAERAA
jgi:branched-chain amino acid transport system permease protein